MKVRTSKDSDASKLLCLLTMSTCSLGSLKDRGTRITRCRIINALRCQQHFLSLVSINDGSWVCPQGVLEGRYFPFPDLDTCQGRTVYNKDKHVIGVGLGVQTSQNFCMYVKEDEIPLSGSYSFLYPSHLPSLLTSHTPCFLERICLRLGGGILYSSALQSSCI